MKFEKLYLDGFGIFCGADLDDLSPGLNVIEGHNEAGKSTTVEFIRSLLFGFQTGRDAQRYEPRRGGQHGGWALARDRSGRRLRIERRPGGGVAGTATVTVEGKSTPLELQELIRGADRKLFSSVFAFSLHELRSLETLQEDGIQGRIYAAATGTGGVSLLEAARAVGNQADKLFKSRGRTQQLNQLIQQRNELKARVAALQEGLKEYNTLQGELERHSALLQQLRQEEQEAREAVVHARALQAAWPHWLELRRVRAELAALPEVSGVPEDGESRLQTLSSHIQALEERRSKLAAQERSLQEQLEACGVEVAVLQAQERINRVCSGLQSYSDTLAALPGLTAERDRHQAIADTALTRLGPGWTEAKLRGLDLSIAREDEIRGYRDALLAARQAVTAAEERLRDAEHRLQEQEKLVRRKAEEIAQRFPEPPVADPRYEEKIRRLEEARDRLEQVARGGGRLSELEREREERRGRLSRLEQDGSTAGAAFPVTAVVAVALAVLVPVLMPQQLAVALVISTAMLGLAAWSWLDVQRRRRDNESVTQRHAREVEESRKQLAALETEISKLNAGLQEHRAWLDATCREFGWALRNTTEVRSLLTVLRSTRELYQAYESELRIRHAREEERNLAAETLGKHREQLAAVQQIQRNRETDWQAWLSEASLPPQASPETALSLLAEADRARRSLQDRDRLQAQIEAAQQALDEYEARVAALFAELGWPKRPADEIPAVVRTLPGALTSAIESREKRASLEERLTDTREEIRESDEQLQIHRDELEALIRSVGAADEAEFRAWVAQAVRHRELEAEERRLVQILETHSAPGEKCAALQAELADLDHERVQQLLDHTLRAVESAELAVDTAQHEAGQRQQRLADLERGEELTSLLRELRATEAELEETAEQWAVLRITQRLLEQTRAQFESQRQPAVIRRAGEFMQRFTDGKYPAVVAPAGLQQVELEDRDARRSGIAEWSRGTAEQLYLALRFAFVENYSRSPGAEPLPLIMDDVLVHADGYARLQLASGVIADLAREHQIFYFTCRPDDAELLASCAPDAHRYRLSDGRFERLHG